MTLRLRRHGIKVCSSEHFSNNNICCPSIFLSIIVSLTSVLSLQYMHYSSCLCHILRNTDAYITVDCDPVICINPTSVETLYILCSAWVVLNRAELFALANAARQPAQTNDFSRRLVLNSRWL